MRQSLISHQATLALIRRIQSGDRDAAEALLAANEGLIHREARALLPFAGLQEYEDLAQEASIGLLHAAGKFDCSRGLRFSTYAVPWVRQHVQRAIENNSRIIRVPIHSSHRKPGEELPEPTASLDYFVCEDEGNTVGDLLQDPETIGWEDATLRRMVTADLLAALRPTERLALTRAFGLDGEDESTCHDLGLLLGCSRQAANQMKQRALARLRKRLEETDRER